MATKSSSYPHTEAARHRLKVRLIAKALQRLLHDCLDQLVVEDVNVVLN